MIPSSTNSVRVLLIIYLFFSLPLRTFTVTTILCILSIFHRAFYSSSFFWSIFWCSIISIHQSAMNFFSLPISRRNLFFCLYKWLNMQNTRFTKFQLRTYINIFACFPPWLNFAFQSSGGLFIVKMAFLLRDYMTLFLLLLFSLTIAWFYEADDALTCGVPEHSTKVRTSRGAHPNSTVPNWNAHAQLIAYNNVE